MRQSRIKVAHATTRRIAAFTLVELVVVVTLILLLIALMMPAMQKAVTTTMTVTCQGNLRELNVSLMGYCADNTGKYFEYRNDSIYMTFLLPYHGNIESLRFCPEAVEINLSGAGYGGKTAWTYGTTLGTKNGSYAVNGFLYGPLQNLTGGGPGGRDYFTGGPVANAWPDAWYRNFSSTPMPALAPAFLDSLWVDLWPMDGDYVPPDLTGVLSGPGNQNYYQMQRACIDRHNRTVNVNFVDGHVDNMNCGKLWNLQWNRPFKRNASVVIP